MKRRQFIALLGGAISISPYRLYGLEAKRKVVGFLSGGSAEGFADQADTFRKGLRQSLGEAYANTSIEYRWGGGHYDRMSALADNLVQAHVDVIFACGGDASTHAAKAATPSIPVVFLLGGDPVASGIVASISRPGGNLTGITLAFSELEQKRLDILHQMVPDSQIFAVLINPTNPRARLDEENIGSAAEKLGRKVVFVHASTLGEFGSALDLAKERGAKALDVASDPLFFDHRDELAQEISKARIPAIHHLAEEVAAGGLMSYGASIKELYRQAGVYVGEILRGAKPSDLPISHPTKYELHINLKAAKELHLKVPTSLMLLADELTE